MEHRGVGDLAHHLAAWAMILGDAQGLAQRILSVAAQAATKGRHAERIPGAGCVVVTDRTMQCDGRAGCNFVGDDHGNERVACGESRVMLGKGAQGRDHGTADMAFGRVQPVMGVEIVDLAGQGKGCTRQPGLPPIKEERGAILGRGRRQEPHGVVTGNAPGVQRRGPGADTERVQQECGGKLHHRCRRVERTQDKIGDRHGKRPFDVPPSDHAPPRTCLDGRDTIAAHDVGPWQMGLGCSEAAPCPV